MLELFYTLTLIIICFFVGYVIKTKKNEHLVKDYAYYQVMLDIFLQKAYDLIYKDEIFIYSLEATKLASSDFDLITKKYIRLVEKLMGPRIVKIYIDFFGNHETFIFYMAENFNARYEDDEIRKTSIDQMQEKEIEAQTPEEFINASGTGTN